MDHSKSVTPVKPGRSLRKRAAYDDQDNSGDKVGPSFTSPEFKVKPEMISYEKSNRTAVKKSQAVSIFKARGELSQQKITRRSRMKEVSHSGTIDLLNEKKDRYLTSKDDKKYFGCELKQQNKERIGIESVSQNVSIGMTNDFGQRRKSSMLNHLASEKDMDATECQLRMNNSSN